MERLIEAEMFQTQTLKKSQSDSYKLFWPLFHSLFWHGCQSSNVWIFTSANQKQLPYGLPLKSKCTQSLWIKNNRGIWVKIKDPGRKSLQRGLADSKQTGHGWRMMGWRGDVDLKSKGPWRWCSKDVESRAVKNKIQFRIFVEFSNKMLHSNFKCVSVSLISDAREMQWRCR